MALVVAVGVNENGEREILEFDIGMTENGPFWTDFLRRLVARGLKGVKLVISDAYEGLKNAISEVLNGMCMAEMPSTFYEEYLKPGASKTSRNGIGHCTNDFCSTGPGISQRTTK